MTAIKGPDEVSAPRRRGKPAAEDAGRSSSRDIIMYVTEKLILDEGYASVTTRRVAKEAGFNSALVHYYFKTTNDLLLAVYRRAQRRHKTRLRKALGSAKPLSALWTLSNDPRTAKLATELLAMANHRPVISLEIANNVESFRQMEIDAITEFLADEPDPGPRSSPTVRVMTLVAIARLLASEKAHGGLLGHAEIEEAVEFWIEEIETSVRK